MAEEEFDLRPPSYGPIPSDVQNQAQALGAQGDALHTAGDQDSALSKYEARAALLKPYEKKPDPPKDNKEGVPHKAEAQAICLTPDVCRSPQAPVPYQVYGTADTGRNFSDNVRYNGKPAMKLDSIFTQTKGDEGGKGGGIVSGTQGAQVRPIQGSTTVFINKKPAVRDKDRCSLNNGNCIGEFRFDPPAPPPGGTDGRPPQSDEAKQSEPKGFGEAFKKYSSTAQTAVGAWDKAGQYWNDPSQVWNDAHSVYESLPSGAQIWEGTQNVAAGAGNVAGKVWNNPVGSAKTAGGWVYDQGASGVETVKGAPQKVSSIYAAGGVPAVAGAAAGVALDIGANVVDPFKKTKAAAEVAGVLKGVGEAEKLAHKGQQLHKAEEAAQASNAGRDGLKVTAEKSAKPHEVQCFDRKGKFKGAQDAAEYDRQLAMQESALNKMSPQDYLNARQAFDPANRDAATAKKIRRNWLYERADQLTLNGLSENAAEAQAAQEARSMAALHELDMYVGGGGGQYSGTGDARINSSIGASWKSRAGAMDDYAKDAIKNGQSKMNVKLKRC